MAPRRVIGRILSLGVPMPGPLVDNYNIISAPSFFDYDAMVVAPHMSGQLIEEIIAGQRELRTFAGADVRLHPERPSDAALADVLARRRDETQRLLEHGGVIAAFLAPPARHRIGEWEVDDFWWLPLPEGIAFAPPAVVPADGTAAHVVEASHPLAPFVISQLGRIAYRARIDERSLPRARVFVRSSGGAAIGADIELDRGRIVLLPALKQFPSGDARYAFSESLQAGVRRTLGVMAQGRAPSWVRAHPLPGLAERARAVDQARSAAEAATAALASAEAAHDELAKYQRLLWQEGSLGLEDVVLDALRLIGCTVYTSHEGGIQARIDDANLLVEIEGSEQPVDLAPHYRLRERVEAALAKRGETPRGVIFVNGQRLRDPAQRCHVTDALRVAAETMRYALAPTAGLYNAVVAQLSGDADAVAAYRQALRTTEGLIQTGA